MCMVSILYFLLNNALLLLLITLICNSFHNLFSLYFEQVDVVTKLLIGRMLAEHHIKESANIKQTVY